MEDQDALGKMIYFQGKLLFVLYLIKGTEVPRSVVFFKYDNGFAYDDKRPLPSSFGKCFAIRPCNCWRRLSGQLRLNKK